MKIGIIGLGRMGYNLALNLLDKKVKVVAFNRTTSKTLKLKKQGGAIPAHSVESLVTQLPRPRKIWLFVPSGRPVDMMITELLKYLDKGDIIIDGGNSLYLNSIKRYKKCKKRGIHFVDQGTSGGLEGARYGASLTIGGDPKITKKIEPIAKKMAKKNGYCIVGPSGSGHFVKMVHNGIEYAILEAYGEGIQLINKGPYQVDFRCITKAWQNGGVIRSWMLELLHNAFLKDQKLSKVVGKIGGGETGRWTVKAAKSYKSPMPAVDLALQQRKKTQKKETYAGRVIAMIRNGFGGHEYKKRK